MAPGVTLQPKGAPGNRHVMKQFFSGNPTSTSNQSSKPCTVLQYPSRKQSVTDPQLVSIILFFSGRFRPAGRILLGARRQGALAPQLPRATLSLEFPPGDLCICRVMGRCSCPDHVMWCKVVYPRHRLGLDCVPFHPKKTRFSEKSAVLCLYA